ncbi:MAG: hypothetical protein PHD76_04055 [Methylacidiphilales bacterium]|nr:hypothetical protein [Candidatus Methylacidiphilales bacterium]
MKTCGLKYFSGRLSFLFYFLYLLAPAYAYDGSYNGAYNARGPDIGVLGERTTFPHSADDSYNIKAGPIEMKVSAGLRTTYSDNIGLSEFNRMEDVIFSPYVNLSATWPMTEYNTLRIGLGVAYYKYLMHSQFDSNGPILSQNTNTDTGVDFTILAGDFRFIIYDHIAYEQDPLQNGTLSNTVNFGELINTAGVHGNWDLNDLQLSLGVAQQNTISTEGSFDYLNRSSQIIDGAATFQLGPATFAGIQASTALTAYEQGVQNNNTRFSVGPFFRTKVTNYLDFDAGAAFELGEFSRGGSNGDNSDLSSYSAYAGLHHRLNRHVSHSLTATRFIDLGTISNYVETWRVEHNASWTVLNNVSLGTNLFVEFSDESGGILADSYTRYGGGLSLGYRLTEQTFSTLSYNYIEKESRIPGYSYYQNSVTLDIQYNF